MVKSYAIRIGRFFFRTRNITFPLLIVAAFSVAVPPGEIFGSARLENLKDFLAIGVALAGLAVRASVIGFSYIKRGGVNKQVYANALVTSGIFGLCRNPLYLANMAIYSAIFLMHGDPRVMALGILLFFGIYQSIIFAEEAYLSEKFGNAYADYCRRTPRWLPWISGIDQRFSAATQGMNFNYRLALVKDYSTMASTAWALIFAESYEQIAAGAWQDNRATVLALASSAVLVGAFAGIVRILKKRNLLTGPSRAS
jgi:protein-S-isoprenylcysteine O-methyltransferase Ste14